MDPKVGPTVDRVLQLVAKRFAEFQNTLPNERLDTRSGVCAERIRRDQPGMVSLAPIPRNIKHPTTPNMHSLIPQLCSCVLQHILHISHRMGNEAAHRSFMSSVMLHSPSRALISIASADDL